MKLIDNNKTRKFTLITLIYLAIALSLVAISVMSCTEKPKPPDISIWSAVAGGHIDIVNQHIAAGTDINKTLQDNVPGYGGTPLHIAALTNQKYIAELLIENGADINAVATDTFGGTPLHWAAFFGNRIMVEFFVEAGADFNAPDRYGFTPLDAALDDTEGIDKEEKDKIADFLRENGGETRD